MAEIFTPVRLNNITGVGNSWRTLTLPDHFYNGVLDATDHAQFESQSEKQ